MTLTESAPVPPDAVKPVVFSEKDFVGVSAGATASEVAVIAMLSPESSVRAGEQIGLICASELGSHSLRKSAANRLSIPSKPLAPLGHGSRTALLHERHSQR